MTARSDDRATFVYIFKLGGAKRIGQLKIFLSADNRRISSDYRPMVGGYPMVTGRLS